MSMERNTFPLGQVLEEAALAFRLGMEGMGSDKLTRFVDEVGPLLGMLSPERLSALNVAFQETCEAQLRKDFLRIADLLEYEISPLLKSAAE